MALLTALSDGEWRLISDTGNPSVDGYQLSRMTTYIDATVADTIFTTRVANDTISNPVADGQTYTGTFAVNKVTQDEGRDERNQRYATLIEDLTLVSAVANIAALAALNPLIIQDNEILNLFGLTNELGEGDGIVYLYYNINPTERANCMGLSDSDLVSNLPGAGWSYHTREFKVMEDNTARFTVTFKKAAWVNITGTTPNRTIASQQTVAYGGYDPENTGKGFDSSITYNSDGIPTAAIDEVLNNQIAGAGNFVANIGVTDKGNGEHSLSKTEIRERATTDQFARRWLHGFARRPTTEVLMWKNLTSADATTVYDDAKTNAADMTGATPAAPSNHVLLSVERLPRNGVNDTGYQMFDVVRTTYIPIWGTAIDDWDNFKDSYKWVDPEWRRVEVYGVLTNQVRFVTYYMHILQTTSRTAAYDFPNDNNSGGAYADEPQGAGNVKNPIASKIHPIGGGRYRVEALCAEAGAWTAYADGDTWDDLGAKT